MAGRQSGARKARPAQTRGTLVLIATLLLGSAVLRIGIGADQAAALDKREPDPKGAASAPAQAEPVTEIEPLLQALRAREQAVTLREEEIARRSQALAFADREITRRMEELRAAEEALRATLALADSAAEDDISRLVAVYENMKPKQAAALFEEMDPAFAAGFLARMRPEAAAGVMAGLDPQIAYAISAILAGRNAEVPRE